jgi:hypothetical protein
MDRTLWLIAIARSQLRRYDPLSGLLLTCWDVNKVVKKLALITSLLLTASVASAGAPGKQTCGWEEVKITIGDWSFKIPEWECTRAPPVVAAPEMDPTSAIAALTLMLGSLAVLRGRRAKTPKA